MRVVRILGVDPGSRLTGYGVIDVVGNQLKCVTHGTLRLTSSSSKSDTPLEDRLLKLHQGLAEVILRHRPQVMSIEKIFFAKNALSALKLGQARGAAILTASIHGLKVVEYSPTEVKSILTGHGQADKEQVAKIIGLLVGAKDFETPDASDGLALAICHAYMIANSSKALNSASQALMSEGVSASGRRKNISLAEAVGIQGSRSKDRPIRK